MGWDTGRMVFSVRHVMRYVWSVRGEVRCVLIVIVMVQKNIYLIVLAWGNVQSTFTRIMCKFLISVRHVWGLVWIVHQKVSVHHARMGFGLWDTVANVCHSVLLSSQFPILIQNNVITAQ